MNAHDANLIAARAWRWQPPSYTQALRSYAMSVWGAVKSRPKSAIASIIAIVTIAFAYRYALQGAALTLRIYADVIVVTAIVYFLIGAALRRWFWDWPALRYVVRIAGVAGVLALMWMGATAHRYVGQYWRYHTLNLVELDTMPITDHERVLSLNGVHTLAKRQRGQTERVTTPVFVRSGAGYGWSMAVEPERAWQQFVDPVDELLFIHGSDATPSLSVRGLIPARFEVGENLLFSRNIYTCARRALGPWRFFNYEPDRAFPLIRPDGTKVYVVPWIKWTGTFFFLFPRPEFGGVQIMEETPAHPFWRRWLWEWPKRLFVGCGHWVRPEDVHKHEYLRGQNLMPDRVSRSIAESFRFQEGFIAPSGYFKSGDIRIADNEDDVNRQPYTSFYRMPRAPGGSDKLYDSFALEPFDEGKRSLVTSVFVPGDGIGPSYVYRHEKRNEAPLGVTWVESQVRASRPNVFWTNWRVEEHRYYIRDIADGNGRVKRRIMYLSIAVLVEKRKDDRGATEVTASAIPEIAITDSDTRAVVWVDPHRPDTWEESARAKFGPLWARNPR